MAQRLWLYAKCALPHLPQLALPCASALMSWETRVPKTLYKWTVLKTWGPICFSEWSGVIQASWGSLSGQALAPRLGCLCHRLHLFDSVVHAGAQVRSSFEGHCGTAAKSGHGVLGLRWVHSTLLPKYYCTSAAGTMLPAEAAHLERRHGNFAKFTPSPCVQTSGTVHAVVLQSCREQASAG